MAPRIYRDAIGRSGIQSVVLEQGVLHDSEQRRAIGTDGQTLHSAIRLTSRRIPQ